MADPAATFDVSGENRPSQASVFGYESGEERCPSMPHFRAYLLDKDGHIISREEIPADTLEAAKTEAFQRFQSKEKKVFGVEIWSGARCLFPRHDKAAS